MSIEERIKNIANMNRDDIIPVYVDLIKIGNPFGPTVRIVNKAIIRRWSKSALIYIKHKAWRVFSKEAQGLPIILKINNHGNRK